MCGMPRYRQHLGMIAAGPFGTVAVNNGRCKRASSSATPARSRFRLLAVIVTILFSFTMTMDCQGAHASIGLRVSPKEEEVGLDISSHGGKVLLVQEMKRSLRQSNHIYFTPGDGSC